MKKIILVLLLIPILSYGQTNISANNATFNGSTNMKGGGLFGGLWGKSDPTTNSILQLEDLGTRNGQLIGFGVEQFADPSTTPFSLFNFGQVTELDIPTANSVVFTGQQTGTYGSFSHFGSGAVTSGFGAGFEGFNPGPATDLLIGGVQATANNGGVATGVPLPEQFPTNTGSATNIRAFDGLAKNWSTGTVTNGVVFYAEAPQNVGGGSFVNAYGLFVADMTAATNNFAIKTGVGKVSVGDAATFNSTVQVGSLGVGAAPLSLSGVFVGNSNLSGTSQIGILSAPQCSSGATVACEGIRARFDTAAAAFTVPNGIAINIVDGNKGAGSTITTNTGLNINPLSNGITNIAINVANPIKNTLATGTAPFIVTSTTPVANLTTVPVAYDHTGAQLANYHLVEDSCVLGTSCAVTLAGSAVYTSSTSYTCTCQDETAIASCKVAQTSGSAFTITGTVADTIRYHCGGN